ncbi:MAG TPA: aminoacyl-tRNA hydrolase [Candidatus Binatia bacterium]|nr:aminoacyl-tRNA hydrolase [Candidatus Binatia bacterium]
MKLIVGLGNPGARYEPTRHNLGFRIVDRLARANQILIDRLRCEALVGEGILGEETLVLAKPQTFMNRSGAAVASLLREYGVGVEDLVVVYDDLDLPFGRIRIRPSGSAGGHRGVASIIESLAGAKFHRVRVGIGRPPEGTDPVDFVLQPFDSQELNQLDAVVDRAAEAVVCLVRDGLKRAMDLYNRADSRG